MLREFNYKQVIAVQTELRMGKGKLAAQVGHAAVSAAEEARLKRPEWWQAWLKEGQRKVVVKVKSLTELLRLKREAIKMGIPCSLIIDCGLTQLPPRSVTCLGVGPAPSNKVDIITGKLPLL